MPHLIRYCNVIVGLFSLLFFLSGALAQSNPSHPFTNSTLVSALPLEQAFVLTLSSQKNALIAQWQIAPGCYLYQNSLKIDVVNKEGKARALINTSLLPAADSIDDPEFGLQKIYRSFLSVPLPATEVFNQTAPEFFVHIHYQGCSETAHFCYPPVSKWYQLRAQAGQIKEITLIEKGPSITQKVTSTSDRSFMAGGIPTFGQKERSIFLDIATFYFLGLLLTFTPCVLPMIPILFGVIVGQKHLNTRKAFWLSFCYVITMAFTYAIAGIIAATLGKNLQAYLQQPIILTAFALLLTYLGLSQVGVIRVNLPPAFRLKELLTKLHAKQESGTYLGAAIMGLLATLISSPCVTVPLIGVLSYISQSGNILLGGSALLAMGLGMGTVLLLMGTLGGKYIPKSGAWTYTINHLFAAMMFALSIWLVDRVMGGPWLLILWGIWCLFVAWSLGTFQSRAGWGGRLGVLFLLYSGLLFWGATSQGNDPLAPLRLNPWRQSESINSAYPMQTIHSLEQLRQLQTQPQESPLLLVFYADWCLACQHLEHRILTAPKIVELLANWQVIKVDVTDYNEENQLFLKKFDIIGPPALVFFDKEGNELRSARIMGETSAKVIEKRLEELNGSRNL